MVDGRGPEKLPGAFAQIINSFHARNKKFTSTDPDGRKWLRYFRHPILIALNKRKFQGA